MYCSTVLVEKGWVTRPAISLPRVLVDSHQLVHTIVRNDTLQHNHATTNGKANHTPPLSDELNVMALPHIRHPVLCRKVTRFHLHANITRVPYLRR